MRAKSFLQAELHQIGLKLESPIKTANAS